VEVKIGIQNVVRELVVETTTTYEEVEESEADLERFRAWLAKIDRRDYFGAPGRADAHAAVERCARALEAFESEAFARDAQPATDHTALRAVPENT